MAIKNLIGPGIGFDSAGDTQVYFLVTRGLNVGEVGTSGPGRFAAAEVQIPGFQQAEVRIPGFQAAEELG